MSKKITLTTEEKINKSVIDLGKDGIFLVSFDDDVVSIDGNWVSIEGIFFPTDGEKRDETLFVWLAKKSEDDIKTWTDIYNAEWDTWEI